jgi:hypothetical protein
MKNRAVSFFTSGSLVIGSAVLFLGAAAFAAIVSGTSTTNISAHVTYTQLTINKPTVSVGDVMVASIAVLDGSIGNVTAPTGWTQIARTDNDVNVTLISYWKVASASEPSTYTWTIDEQTKAVGGITPYTGVDTTNPINTVAGNTGFGTTATTSAITASAPNEEVIALFATDVSKTFSAPTGMTEKYDLSHTAAGPATAADDAIQTSAGTVTSKSSTITGNKARNWSSQQIALRPVPVVTTAPMTVDGNTLALWSMNGIVGSSAKKTDDGSAGLNLAEVSSPTSGTGWTTPTSNGAYVLDGSSQFLTASDTGFVTGNGARTIEAWVYRNSGSSDDMILSYGTEASSEEWVFAVLSGSGKLYTQDNTVNNCSSVGSVSAGAWHYVAETYDGSTVRFYIDGVPAGSCTYSQPSNTVLTGTVDIGDYNNVVLGHREDFFNGSIDQVKASSGAKSATDIYNYYYGL